MQSGTKEYQEQWRHDNPSKNREYSVKYRLTHVGRRLIQVAKSRAKKRGIIFTLSCKEIDVPDECPILGIKLEPFIGSPGGRDNSPSLDRIDPSKGYEDGNIQVISHKANSMKFTASKEELIKFADWIYREYKL